MIGLDAFLVDNFLFYGIFESIILLIIGIFEIQLLRAYFKRKTTTQLYLVLFILMLMGSTFSSILLKVVWYFTDIDFETSNFLFLFDRGFFVYTFTIIANLCYLSFQRRLFSRKYQPIDFIYQVISGILLILVSIRSIPAIYLDISILLQSLMTYIPLMLKSLNFIKKIHNPTRVIMQNIFLYNLMLCLLWISNFFDGLWDLFGGKSFGPFYYIIWLFSLLSIFFMNKANFKTIETKNFTQSPLTSLAPQSITLQDESLKEIDQSLSSDNILIECPTCHHATFYSINPKLQRLCKQSNSGLTSVFIRRNLTCQHAFMVYLDKDITIRHYESLDYTTDVDFLLKELPDLFFHLTSDGRILDVLGNQETLLMPIDQILGQKITNILPQDVAIQAQLALQTCIEEQKEITFPYNLSTHHEEFAYEARLIPIKEHTLIAIIQDITARKNAEEKLLREQLRIEKNESISLLAGGIAHDFNNILVSFFGGVNLLQLDDNLSAENVDILNDLEKAASRAKDLTDQLLAFSKADSKTLTKYPTDLLTIIREAISLTMRGAKSVCITHFPPDLDPIPINPGQMSQVFNNLLINANQAMANGGSITVSVESIYFSPSLEPNLPLAEGNFIHISVSDEGEGIPLEVQDHIFEPYYTTKNKGNGLGLATCFSIIANHGGHITFETEEKKGTTFHIYLPQNS